MIRIAICDDILTHCRIAEEKISSYFSGKTLACSIDIYLSGSALLESDVSYDLLIMDIALGKENGMDIAKKYSSGRRTRVILLSSHREELPNGYKIGAFRFLIKPIDDGALTEAMDSALAALGQEHRLTCFDENGRECHIYLSEILYIEAGHRKCCVRTTSETYDCFSGIQKISDELGSPDFFQTHKSYIVNMNYIRSFGKQELLLYNGERVPVSRSNRECFRSEYKNYVRRRVTQ